MLALPPDILRHIGKQFTELPDILRFCASGKPIYRAVCQNEAFWTDLGRVYLTEHPERLEKIKASGNTIRSILTKAYIFKDVDQYDADDNRRDTLFDEAVEFGLEKLFRDADSQRILESLSLEGYEGILQGIAERGYLDIFEELREMSEHQSDLTSNVGLNEAAKNGHLSIVKYILNRDQSFDLEDDESPPELYLSQAFVSAFKSKDNFPMINFLIEQGVNPATSGYPYTGEMANNAAAKISLDYIKFLRSLDAKINAGTITSAVSNKDPKEAERILRYLLDEPDGPHLTIDNVYILGFLHKNNVDLIPYLLNHGAGPDNDLLRRLIDNCGTPEAIRKAAGYGLNVHANNEDAIRVALLRKDKDALPIVKVLLDAGANLEPHRGIVKFARPEVQEYVSSILPPAPQKPPAQAIPGWDYSSARCQQKTLQGLQCKRITILFSTW